MADSLIQQVKEGFGSVLLTHLDCLVVFSFIPGLQAECSSLLPLLKSDLRHYSCGEVLSVINLKYLGQFLYESQYAICE